MHLEMYSERPSLMLGMISATEKFRRYLEPSRNNWVRKGWGRTEVSVVTTWPSVLSWQWGKQWYMGSCLGGEGGGWWRPEGPFW